MEMSLDLDDKESIKEVLKKIQDDRTLMPAAMKLFKEDQEINRQMTKAVYEMQYKKDNKGVPRHRLDAMSRQAQKSMALQKRDNAMTPGEFVCVSVTNNGKRSRMTYNPSLFDTDAYTAYSTVIGDAMFYVVTHESCLSEKTNKLATYLLNRQGMECCGSTGFMMLDEDGEAKDVQVKHFNDLVESEQKKRPSQK